MRLFRRASAWLLVLALALVLMPRGRAAASGVYFTAANDQLLDLNGETMPFLSNGMLYVPNTVFQGTDLGVSFARNYGMHLALLYTAQTDLRFDLENQSAWDKLGNQYDTYAIERGDCVFFPLDVVCRHFGLDWSFTQTANAPLIRITTSGAVLNTEEFTSAAATQMENYYNAYQRQLEEQTADTRPAPADPVIPPVQTGEGQQVRLLITGRDTEATAELLALLENAQVQATFLLDTEAMEDGDLVRGIASGGHAIALAAEGETARAVESELRRGRELLWEAGCLWLELVWYGGEDDISGLLEEMGCGRVRAELDLQSTGLGSASRARRLLTSIERHGGEEVSVHLGDDKGCLRGLEVLLRELAEAGCPVSPWRLQNAG
ncbi:MAG: hypothetical protein HFF79_00060 [Oscillospiraceae bacterium]|nr:hypothetical protein [Oscillospiraceae bacterium]